MANDSDIPFYMRLKPKKPSGKTKQQSEQEKQRLLQDFVKSDHIQKVIRGYKKHRSNILLGIRQNAEPRKPRVGVDVSKNGISLETWQNLK